MCVYIYFLSSNLTKIAYVKYQTVIFFKHMLNGRIMRKMLRLDAFAYANTYSLALDSFWISLMQLV